VDADVDHGRAGLDAALALVERRVGDVFPHDQRVGIDAVDGLAELGDGADNGVEPHDWLRSCWEVRW